MFLSLRNYNQVDKIKSDKLLGPLHTKFWVQRLQVTLQSP